MISVYAMHICRVHEVKSDKSPSIVKKRNVSKLCLLFEHEKMGQKLISLIHFCIIYPYTLAKSLNNKKFGDNDLARREINA